MTEIVVEPAAEMRALMDMFRDIMTCCGRPTPLLRLTNGRVTSVHCSACRAEYVPFSEMNAVPTPGRGEAPLPGPVPADPAPNDGAATAVGDVGSTDDVAGAEPVSRSTVAPGSAYVRDFPFWGYE